MTTPHPFAGKNGMIHLRNGRAYVMRINTALCGRSIDAYTTYIPESVPRLKEEHDRLNKTHKTYTCRGCFAKLKTDATA